MLYPRENRQQKKLEYYCKQEDCHYVYRDVQNQCVFVNELVKDSSTRLEVINSDLNKDPTLQRTRDVVCEECHNNEAVFFQAEQTAKSVALTLVYVCCSCGKKWMDEPVATQK
eukprot:gene27589-33322_t